MSDSPAQRLSVDKALIALVPAETAIGPFVADRNETHIYNPPGPRTRSSATPRP